MRKSRRYVCKWLEESEVATKLREPTPIHAPTTHLSSWSREDLYSGRPWSVHGLHRCKRSTQPCTAWRSAMWRSVCCAIWSVRTPVSNTNVLLSMSQMMRRYESCCWLTQSPNSVTMEVPSGGEPARVNRDRRTGGQPESMMQRPLAPRAERKKRSARSLPVKRHRGSRGDGTRLWS